MTHYAYVNGRFVRHESAKVHVEDRGLQFADSVYEVIACIHGDLADEAGHLDRLERSLGEIRMELPVPREEISQIIRTLLKKNRYDNASVYIQVTRGAAKRDFKFPDPVKVKPTLIMTAWPVDFEAIALKPIKVITVPDLRWKRRDIKTTSLLWQSMAKQQAFEEGADDAWLVDDSGLVTEGASNNAWILKGNVLQTRPATNDILCGITRMSVQKIATERGLQIVEKAFSPEEAFAADEAFSTAAIICVAPVVAIDGHVIGDGAPGPVTRAIYDEYRAYVAGRQQQGKQAAAG